MNRNITIEELVDLIRSHHRIVAFTGAGISTDSGIPDLDGMRAVLKEYASEIGIFDLLNKSFVEQNPKLFYELYRKTFFQPESIPNACHRLLAMLEKQNKLLGVATMNIDYLHQKAGSKTVYEYWGNIRLNKCSQCNQVYDWDIIIDNEIPVCTECGGLIIPDFILRGLGTYPENIKQGSNIIQQADLILIAGVRNNYRNFPKETPKVIVNRENMDLSDRNTFFIRKNIETVFNELNSNLKEYL